MNNRKKLVLASSSIFRQQLLEKLHLEFSCQSPDIDESSLDNESPESLVERLSIEKAQAVANTLTTPEETLIIGSDQVVSVNGNIFGKPGNFENAFRQLKSVSGKKAVFLTGLALLNSKTARLQSTVEIFNVYFRKLTDEQIARYLHQEEPYQCAGSFKSEGYGISLFQRFEGDDPNSLIGLPLMKLIEFFDQEGICLP